MQLNVHSLAGQGAKRLLVQHLNAESGEKQPRLFLSAGYIQSNVMLLKAY